MRTFPFLPGRCPCGAPATPGNQRCRKCRARWRWHRRKSRHDGI
ncbi:hypothetical protein AB0K18_48035 [Nonomuraea sp. NPDC049421]